MAQLFPDVISKQLYSGHAVDHTFTVPAEYAFAMVQVRFIAINPTGESVFNSTHGVYYSNFSVPDTTNVNPPVLNLIIKGGESFSLTNNTKASITALCHRRPT